MQFQAWPSSDREAPKDSHVLTAQGVMFSPNFLFPGDRGSESEKFSTVLKEKCRNFSVCPYWRQLEKQVFLYNFITIFAKQKMSTVSLITYTIFGHFGHFDKIFRSSKGHFTWSSLKLCVPYRLEIDWYIKGLHSCKWTLDLVLEHPDPMMCCAQIIE